MRLRYSVFGLTVDSEIELGYIPQDIPGPADILIRLGEVSDLTNKISADEEFATFGSIGAFQIRAGREIVVQQGPDASDDLISVLLCGRIMAYLLRQRGWLPLHASAVRIKDEAVLFVAPSRTGKSTMAAAFHTRGYPVLTDDVAPVRVIAGTCFLSCGPARLRLCTDAAMNFRALDPHAGLVYDKHSFQLGSDRNRQYLPVSRIYLLVDGVDLEITPLSTLDGFGALGRECFIRLRRADPPVLKAHLRDCASVAEITPIRRLTRPKNLACLEDVIEMVEQDLDLSSRATPRC